MPTITIPEETYQRLAARAAALNTTVEQLAAPALADLISEPAGAGSPASSSTSELPYPEWKRRFDAHMQAVEARASQYPPGHITDVSRESMYEGCGE